MKPPKTAMILAAGRGTRMGSLTENRPKPLLQVGGRAIVDHAVARLAGAGVDRLVVNLHHKGEMIRKHLIAACDGSGAELAFSVEDELLETGGGIANALGLLGDAPFYAANGDVIWLDSGEFAALYLDNKNDLSPRDILAGVVGNYVDITI